ncbi:YcxB family protein [Ilyomonas limi]|uniref:YcxB family protein n=1 Tax=Ilyomonas limi TaxID=2575867 RepID=A0A4U3L524_9BACT|nr:YcxB family protein [Ilyomonas limi]TKK70248.1 YcxB family protein [Ilyomonas limi]
MQFSISYNKKKVIQGLRYHFITRKEIRILLILVNIFAITSAVLFYTKRIRPEPFLLSSIIWIFLMISFWYLLPNIIYRRSGTFKDNFTIFILERQVRLQNKRGYVEWSWNKFTHYFESPNFFHLYFSPKSFFLLPKECIPPDRLDDLRTIFRTHITHRSAK